MKIQHRIPTLLGLLLIAVSLGATVFFLQSFRSYFGQANVDTTPSEVKITNISDTTFTVSWITTSNITGTVNFGENSSLGNIAMDDRDQASGKTSEYTIHHITLKYLKPSTRYFFKIISGGKTFDNNSQQYLVTTAPTTTVPPPTANPAYGTIKKTDDTPAEGAIVYLTSSASTPLSTLVKTSGNWLIPLNSARSADLANFLTLGSSDKIELFVQAGKDGTAQATTNTANHSPVPQIILGKSYSFSQAEADLMSNPMATPTATPTVRPSLSPNPTPSSTPQAENETPTLAFNPSLISPATEAAVPSDRPFLKGTGIPGKTINITIESSTPVSGTTTVDQNGNWTWTPPSRLSSGDHTITIKTNDKNNNPVEIVRKFTVLASGTQVAEAATPPATLRPSPTSTPKLTPTPSPTPKSTSSPKPTPTLKPSPIATAPTSGNPTFTVFLLLTGLTLFALGLGKLFLLDNS